MKLNKIFNNLFDKKDKKPIRQISNDKDLDTIDDLN
jgi:hypothetical protein